MVMLKKHKYLDWTTLKKLVEKAKRLKLNRGSEIDVWKLDASKLFPVVLAMPLDDGGIFRCQIVGKEDGKFFFLDILPKDINKIKSVSIPA